MAKLETATFGAGCFWHIQAGFDKIQGVVETVVGYMGGTTKNPTYEDVCTDETGHVEVCQVTFNPSKVSFKKLLEAFWKMHDPTQTNGQGPDIGSQYRSVIFYHTPEQRLATIKSRNETQEKFDDVIATEIEPAKEFYKAEEYHQKYQEKTGKKVC